MVCNAKCSMCSMKCTYAVSSAFAGAGRVHYVHCAVCRVQCAACKRWKLSGWKRMSQNSNLYFQIASQKYIVLNLTYPKSFFQLILRNTLIRVQDVCQINIPGDWHQLNV